MGKYWQKLPTFAKNSKQIEKITIFSTKIIKMILIIPIANILVNYSKKWVNIAKPFKKIPKIAKHRQKLQKWPGLCPQYQHLFNIFKTLCQLDNKNCNDHIFWKSLFPFGVLFIYGWVVLGGVQNVLLRTYHMCAIIETQSVLNKYGYICICLPLKSPNKVII